MLQSMGLQRARHDWVIELNWLMWQKRLCNVIKEFELERSFWVIQVNSVYHNGFVNKSMKVRVREGDVVMEAEIRERLLKGRHCWPWKWRKGLWSKECGEPLEDGTAKETDCTLQNLEGMQPTNNWLRAFLTSRNEDNTFVLICMACYSISRKLTHQPSGM